jgi:3-oxoacyl-[acyl-carrier protein] reductase
MSELTRPVVVTGAGQGLGRAVALAFGQADMPVVVSDINRDRAKAVAQEITSLGGAAIAVSADVSVESDVVTLGARAESVYGPLRTWINNAGVGRPAMLHKMTYDDFMAVLSVHAGGTFLGMREAARRMIAHGLGGVILNVTSSAGLQGTIGQINYSAAKGAIVSATKSAAKELARHGIRVNAIAPLAATSMTERLRTDEKLSARFLAQVPMGRFAEVTEIAPTFVHLASDAAAYMTGQIVCVDGGLYMAS